MNNYEQVTQEVRDAFDALCKSRVKAAVEAEREACAKLCDEVGMLHELSQGAELAFDLATAIRSRGNT